MQYKVAGGIYHLEIIYWYLPHTRTRYFLIEVMIFFKAFSELAVHMLQISN